MTKGQEDLEAALQFRRIAGIPLREAQDEIDALRARVAELEGALTLLRSLVQEGGVPRYTVIPGAALNSAIEEVVDPALGFRGIRGGKP